MNRERALAKETESNQQRLVRNAHTSTAEKEAAVVGIIGAGAMGVDTFGSGQRTHEGDDVRRNGQLRCNLQRRPFAYAILAFAIFVIWIGRRRRRVMLRSATTARRLGRFHCDRLRIGAGSTSQRARQQVDGQKQ
jgi:hypothetical protein